ncbi:MAG TPA: glycosyltransferase family A protein [Rhodocyclaceae bacterium]|nr:glycosyltransferase family A protein [Rhodocyclaceae bacterium]
MPPILSIICHFYGHQDKVAGQIRHWGQLPSELLERIEFVIVDDCSESPLVLPQHNLNLRLFRITSDIPWNQGGARNLGATKAQGKWGMFFDIDQRLQLETVQLLMDLVEKVEPRNTFLYFRIRELIDVQTNETLPCHPNTFLTHLGDFRERGMYDEDFSGYYGYEDLYLITAWEKRGGARIVLNQPVFFEDMGFGTTNLDRSKERNKCLMDDKVKAGCPSSSDILRFDWVELSPVSAQ